jgi:hypothetical protein
MAPFPWPISHPSQVSERDFPSKARGYFPNLWDNGNSNTLVLFYKSKQFFIWKWNILVVGTIPLFRVLGSMERQGSIDLFLQNGCFEARSGSLNPFPFLKNTLGTDMPCPRHLLSLLPDSGKVVLQSSQEQKLQLKSHSSSHKTPRFISHSVFMTEQLLRPISCHRNELNYRNFSLSKWLPLYLEWSTPLYLMP